MTAPKSYIIHLDRAVTRRPRVEVLLARLGHAAEIMPAVDGTSFTDAEVSRHLRPAFSPHYPFALTRAEIATFLSHRACWQRIIDEDHPHALILEDDVDLTAPFDEALDLAMRHAAPGAFIRFPVKDREEPSHVLARQGGSAIFRPRVIGLGMQAQLVTQDAARRLLDMTHTFDRPVDSFLQARWHHGIDVLTLWASGITERSAELGGSQISRSLPIHRMLLHELLRPIYRTKVALHSRGIRG